MGRREQIASLGQTLMVIGGCGWPVLLAAKLKAVPPKLAVYVLAIGFLTFCLTLIWRGGINATHRATVLGLADRARQLADGVALNVWSNDAEEQTFRAHLPGKVTMQVGRVKHAMSAEPSAWEALRDSVKQSAKETFPSSEVEPWQTGGIITNALAALKDERDRVNSDDLQIRRQRLTANPELGPLPDIVWGVSPIWSTTSWWPAANITDPELDERIQTVRDWFSEVSKGEPAIVYRDALWNTYTDRRELAKAVAPILEYGRLDWRRRCFFCRPKRWWQFWR